MSHEFPSAVSEVFPESLDYVVDLRLKYKEEIARALDLICHDSRAFPDRYLEETTVPHGGE